MPQLVHEPCGVCHHLIEDERDAEFCLDCGRPVHHFCHRETYGVPGRCASCGTHLGGRKRVRKGRPADFGPSPRPKGGLLHYLFSFEGRAGRATYVGHHFLDGFVVLAIIGGVGALAEDLGGNVFPLAVATVLVVLAVMSWSSVAVTVRRLHDLNHPGWYWWLQAMPFVNFLFWLYLLLAPGTPGSNHYGPPPGTAELDEPLGVPSRAGAA